MKKQVKTITMLNVLEALTAGHELFTFIANHVDSFGLSHRQYYERLSKLTKMHLIKRIRGKYLLTNFGGVIFQLYLTLVNAINESRRPAVASQPPASGLMPTSQKLM
jgi:predicted transcriptional regulator